MEEEKSVPPGVPQAQEAYETGLGGPEGGEEGTHMAAASSGGKGGGHGGWRVAEI
jgi:hypothetical protein